jgi:hypothetical protein
MANASSVEENRQGDLGIAFHHVLVQRRQAGIFIFVILRRCCPGPAQTTIKAKIKAAIARHFLAFRRFLPTRSILDLAAPTEDAGINQGKTLLCRSRIAQGI